MQDVNLSTEHKVSSGKHKKIFTPKYQFKTGSATTGARKTL
jgi:hypothetical protein